MALFLRRFSLDATVYMNANDRAKMTAMAMLNEHMGYFLLVEESHGDVDVAIDRKYCLQTGIPEGRIAACKSHSKNSRI